MSKNKPWIVSPAWDGLWMFAPFWGCLLFFVAIQVLGLAQSVLYFFAFMHRSVAAARPADLKD